MEYFSILGGVEQCMELNYFEDIFSMVESNFVQEFSKFQTLISPSYLLESPYREILMAVARGDGKFYSVLRKAKISESIGSEIIDELIALNVLSLESTREQPLRLHPKHKLKKELRSYRIQDKLRFVSPFVRFWFGFVAYYSKALEVGDGSAFLENFQQNYERLRSLVYEQLCDALLTEYYASTTPLLQSGSYWDQHSEFDILAITNSKKLILAECKYKERKVCKNELGKLKVKALQSGIKVDVYVLFSKSGFSKELLQLKEKDVLLFDLNDLKQIL
ncbi:MAG: DUF234 domain-containing protein [Campylobacterota bacterium]|nr:DUF234 domain-containing protein [Campylobacterota bacterium]